MTVVTRLRHIASVLGIVAVSGMIGRAVLGELRDSGDPETAQPIAANSEASIDEAQTKFSKMPALSYINADDQSLFAWSLKPKLEVHQILPRDILVMVDTSATQAGKPLQMAQQVLVALAGTVDAEDRIDLWTINTNHKSTTRSLSEGLQSPDAEQLRAGIDRLTDVEYGSGAVDLPEGLKRAARTLPNNPGRQQVVLYLGDGESSASAKELSEAGRVDLGNSLVDRRVSFFAVPLGSSVHPINLHGLATITGGAVVRLDNPLQSKFERDEFAGKLMRVIDVPVLRLDSVQYGPDIAETFPTRLPPLRADRTTLVVGRLKQPTAMLSAKLQGAVQGRQVSLTMAEALPAAKLEHYFLNPMYLQWHEADAQDAPAILPADRTLAMASEQFRLYRDEFTTQAVWAISDNRLDHAEKLFQAAAQIDPNNESNAAAKTVLARVRQGELPRSTVRNSLSTSMNVKSMLDYLSSVEPVNATMQPVNPPRAGVTPQPVPAAPVAPALPPGASGLINQARAEQRIAEQQIRGVVDNTIRNARRLNPVDPDSAYQDLKRQRDSVLSDDRISDAVRRRLVLELEAEMRQVELKGSEIKRQLAVQRERVAQARLRLDELQTAISLQAQTRARIDAFTQLMKQARFELAQQEAQVMIQERVSRGLPVPVATYASYRIGQAATNVRELRELERIRQDRFLLTMLQVEKSFIPYPDEPPVHFPPAAVWRELTGRRATLYGNDSLGYEAPESFRQLRSLIEGETDERVNIPNIGAYDLRTLLNKVEQEFPGYNLKFVFRKDLFGDEIVGPPGETPIKTESDLQGLPLGAFLDIVLRDVNMSWIARPEYIEIGPLQELRYNQKATRVFDVADLIIGIPQSVNPQSLYANLQFLGQQSTIFGAAFVPQFGFAGNGVNPFGAQGGIQGGFGAAGGIGGGVGLGGGLGGGGIGGFAGAGGAGLDGGGQGLQGGFGGQGFGLGGMQGGVSGNINNLSGGQFGIQGNDQSMFLLQLITTVVAKGEWDLNAVSGTQQPLFGEAQLAELQSGDLGIERSSLNSLGFYPPARALIVRASSRYHTSPSFKLKGANDAFGVGPAGPGLPGKADMAKAKNPKEQAVNVVNEGDADPTKVWNKAFAQQVTNPELVIDAVDILFHAEEYTHAAEALKASLRQGRVDGDWTHEALAIALEAGQAAPEEVERAALSGIDLEPNDPNAYLLAARTESDLKHYDQALAFCRRASSLEPNLVTPYADALTYAGQSDAIATDAVEWATANILNRDWAGDTIDRHAQAKKQISSIAEKLTEKGRDREAEQLQAIVAEPKTRDVVVELVWQGQADLDLSVSEPSGSVCSPTQRNTTGGGTLKCDILEQENDHSERYSAAQGYSGTYEINVRSVTGRPVGNRARLIMTKYQGTTDEVVESRTIDLSNPKPITFQLDGGHRAELASVPTLTTVAQQATTQAPETYAPQGLAGGVGAGSDRLLSGPVAGGTTSLPPVIPSVESRLKGITPGTDMRLEQKVSSDRQSVVMNAKPVFTGEAKDIPMPKLNLLPGN